MKYCRLCRHTYEYDEVVIEDMDEGICHQCLEDRESMEDEDF